MKRLFKGGGNAFLRVMGWKHDAPSETKWKGLMVKEMRANGHHQGNAPKGTGATGMAYYRIKINTPEGGGKWKKK